jgi:hypothetical protein
VRYVAINNFNHLFANLNQAGEPEIEPRFLPRGEPGRATRVSSLMRRCGKKEGGRRAGSEDSKTANVALLNVVHEMPSFWWCGGIGTIRPDEPVRVAFFPRNGGVPLRVRSICLPFILVKTPSGKLRNLDVRRCRLARLDRAHALAAWKAYKRSRNKREHA